MRSSLTGDLEFFFSNAPNLFEDENPFDSSDVKDSNIFDMGNKDHNNIINKLQLRLLSNTFQTSMNNKTGFDLSETKMYEINEEENAHNSGKEGVFMAANMNGWDIGNETTLPYTPNTNEQIQVSTNITDEDTTLPYLVNDTTSPSDQQTMVDKIDDSTVMLDDNDSFFKS